MSSYSDLVLAHGSLVGYWRLGDANAAAGAQDATTNNRDGVYAGTSLTFGVAGAIANDADTAISIDNTSTDTPVEVADVAALDFTDGPFSYEIWVKRSSTQGANQGLISKGAGAGLLRFLATNSVGFSKQGTAGEIASSSVTITDTTTWHHIVATKTGSTTKVYVDGADVTSAGTNQTLTDTAVNLRIGSVGTAQRFIGSIDDVAVYNAVLTPTEVRQHYDTGKGARAEADSVTASDAQTSAPVKTAADSVTTTDAQATTVGHPLSDSVSATDAVSNAPQSAQADSVTASDALSNAVTLGLDEAVSVTDQFSATEENALTLGDSVTASDATAATVETSLADDVTVSDDLTSVSGIEHTETPADSVTVSDAITPTLTEGVVGWPRMGGGIAIEPPALRHRLELDDFVWVVDDLDIESEMDPELRRQEEMAVLLLA